MPIHLFLAHFPVALLVAGAAADLFGAALGSESTRRTAGALLIWGAVAAVLALLSGSAAASSALARVPAPVAALEAHTQWGGAGTWLLAGAGLLRALWRKRLHGVHGWVTLGAGVLAAGLVVAISLSGTAIAHGPLP